MPHMNDRAIINGLIEELQGHCPMHRFMLGMHDILIYNKAGTFMGMAVTTETGIHLTVHPEYIVEYADPEMVQKLIDRLNKR